MSHEISVRAARPSEGAATRRQELADLYEPDETAWLEESSRRIRAGQLDELDYTNLATYLEDTSRSDRREVESRLETLVSHLLKWHYQPDQRSRSWRLTIAEQRRSLKRLLSATLRRHAEARLASCYEGAVEFAAIVTGLPEDHFPKECPYSLDQILTEELS
jgi:hypothetical protein